MAGTLNETPGSNRLHIGIFGKTNSGKSSFINAFTKQEVSIVADVAGTTTDPVYKPMEIYPLGPCVIIDTAGFDDESALGERRVEKTRLAAEKTDIAVILVSDLRQNVELEWYRFFKEKNTPVLFVISKADVLADADVIAAEIRSETGEDALLISARTGEGMERVREALARLVPENFGSRLITGIYRYPLPCFSWRRKPLSSRRLSSATTVLTLQFRSARAWSSWGRVMGSLALHSACITASSASGSRLLSFFMWFPSLVGFICYICNIYVFILRL